MRKPSRAYIDQYIRGHPPADQQSHRTPIFVKLEHNCPSQYLPTLHTSSQSLPAVRVALLLLCGLQFVVSLVVFYLTSTTHYLHSIHNELFTEAVAVLCALAACAGLVGVAASWRPMLLVLYINQLWGLSCLSTFAVLQLTSEEQGAAACSLYRSGGLTAQQLEDAEVDCDELERTAHLLMLLLLVLAALLWSVCFLSKLYSEGLQDKENDETNVAIIDFVWQRRRETWAKLERFEQVVQQQFEELRRSLAAHAQQAQSAGARSPRGS